MTHVVYAAAATEPVTIAEVMAHLRLDSSNQEPSPSAPTVALASPAAAGNVEAGAHRYRVTFVTSSGETEGGTVSSAVTVVNAAINGQVKLTAIPLGGSAVTSRKIYRTTAGGSTYLLLATIADNTTVIYTDNTADGSLGAGCPSTNTTTDPVLSILIASARAAAEAELHRYLVTQTIDAYFDGFPLYNNDKWPPREIRLPPMQSVTEITYVDLNGATQTLAADQYIVDATSQPSRITPAYGVVWPSVRDQVNSVKVRFLAGYGAASAVPSCIKQWILTRVATLYENRSELILDARGLIRIPPSFIDGLLDSERVPGRL